MSEINRNLILLGRQLRQISQSKLASRVGITQGHLSKIEQGLLEPAGELADRIAQAMGFPPSFLRQPDRVVGMPVSVHPMFRKKSNLGVKVLDSVEAELNIRIMNLRRLLKATELQPELPLPKLDIDEYDGDAAEIARLVRRSWLIPRGPIDNLTEYVERAGCIIVDSDLGESDIDGVTVAMPGLPPCIFLNRNRPADRRRFTLAHELGHLVMHQVPSPTMEDEANEFASCLLMPAEDISSHLSSVTIPRLASLKPIWKVSMAALLMRAKSLGKVSANQNSYLWRQMAPYRRREPPELDFPQERPTTMDGLLGLHLRELGYSAAELSDALHLPFDDFQNFYKVGDSRLRLVK